MSAEEVDFGGSGTPVLLVEEADALGTELVSYDLIHLYVTRQLDIALSLPTEFGVLSLESAILKVFLPFCRVGMSPPFFNLINSVF